MEDNNKFIMLNMGDESSKDIAEVMSNKTSKKIINLLAEKELTESEISNELDIPLNTVDYNIKKLLKTGLVEKASHWWSVKGKKMHSFRITNKYIVITPKKSALDKLKGFFPVAGAIAFGALLVNFISRETEQIEVMSASDAMIESFEATGPVVESAVPSVFNALLNSNWFWFSAGALLAVLVYMLINWKKL